MNDLKLKSDMWVYLALVAVAAAAGIGLFYTYEHDKELLPHAHLTRF